MRLHFPTPPRRLASPMALALGLTAVLGLPGCLTTTSSEPVGLDQAILTSIPVSRAWIVQDRDEIVGSVVRYSEPGADGRFIYVVRNLWDQDLGLIDAGGRAWKRIPHEEDRWIGTGTVVQGVRQILDTGVAAQMVELPIQEVESATAAARED